MLITSLVKRFDLFSQPFTFFIDKNSKKKKTLFGGILSVIIISISMSYFIYLLYLYFSDRFLPKISSSYYHEIDLQTLTLNESLFAYQIYAQGKTLKEIEQETGKKYLQYYLRYSIYTAMGSQSIEIPLKQCGENTIYQGYDCMDVDSFSPEQKILRQFPNQIEVNNYEFIISECKGQPDCASKQEIQDILLQKDTTLFIKISITQYNQTSQQFQTSFKIDYFQFDNDLTVMSTYSMSKSITKIDKGLFFQGRKTTEHLVDFKKVDRYYSQQKMLTKLGYEGYFFIAFELDQFYMLNHIQFPMITEILSQFMGILNILLAVGILAQIFSESRMIEDVNSIYLKEYFKNTAMKLICNEKKFAPKINDDWNAVGNTIFELQKQINEFDFVEKQKETFKVSFGKRLKMLVFRIFNRIEKQTSSQEKIYQKMIKQTVERIDIQELYKDLIKLKMAIKLILTKEQYVALQFCGCDINLEYQINEKQQIKVKYKEKSQNLKIDPIIPSEIINHEVHQTYFNFLSQQKNIKKSMIKQNKEDDKQKVKLYTSNGDQSDTFEQGQINIQNEIIEKSQRKKVNKKQNTFEIEIIEEQNELIEYDKKQIKNHLQEIDDLMNNQTELKKYLNKFIQNNINKSKQISYIDQNIFSALIDYSQYNIYNIAEKQSKYKSKQHKVNNNSKLGTNKEKLQIF